MPMLNVRRVLFVLLVAAFLLAPGCLQRLTSANTAYGANYAKNLQKSAIYDESTIQQCRLGECICMACKNVSFSWFRPFTSMMVGGNCYFLKNCTSDKYLLLANRTLKPSEAPRRFMIGQGYSFNDFGDANPWCGNRLDMAVQWLIGDNDTPYSLADPARARCLLDKGVMPVYVLYSNSQAVDANRAGNISYTLGHGGPLYGALGNVQGLSGIISQTGGPVGPVIITTEMDFNSSNDEVVRNVTDQIRQIDRFCGNNRAVDPPLIYCMVALGVQMGDTEGVRKVMEQLGPDSNKVDLIAFGINAHRINLNESNEQACNSGNALLQALNFAQFALYNYSKPTVIPYVMFDANGTDSAGSCNWSEAAMDDALLTTMSPGSLVAFQKAGVIGVAAYDFNSSMWSLTNPLNCLDCAIGKNDLRLRAWFGSCTLNKVRTIGSVPAGDNAIVFSNESGGTCDYNVQPLGLIQMVFGDSANPQLPASAPRNDTAFRCDACVSDNFSFPFSVPVVHIVTPANNETYCSGVPSLNIFSGRRNLDPSLVRAIAIGESGMNPCSAACVVAPGVTKSGCMSECYGKALDFVPEPDADTNCQVVAPGQTPTTAQQYEFWNPPPPDASGNAQYRWCGLGLMGVIEPPYTMWPAPYYVDPQTGLPGGNGPFFDGKKLGNYQLFKEAQIAGNTANIAGAKSECGDKYNPFNSTYAACMGTYKFSVNLDSAKKILSSDAANSVADQVNVATLPGQLPDKKNALAYYIALHKYRGFWDAKFTDYPQFTSQIADVGGLSRSKISYGEQWVADFAFQKIFTAAYIATLPTAQQQTLQQTISNRPACFGNQDFISFVRECEFKERFMAPIPLDSFANGPFYGDYGSSVLSYYLDLSNSCGNAYCPSWKRLAGELCQAPPKGGMPAVEGGDRCIPLTS